MLQDAVLPGGRSCGSKAQSCGIATGMARRPKGAAPAREGGDAAARQGQRRAPRPALGGGRQDLCLRDPGREEDAGRAVRGPQPARSSTISCSGRTGRRVARAARSSPTISTARCPISSIMTSPSSSSRARRSPRSRPTRRAHGLALPLGVVAWERFQLRLPCLLHQGRPGEGPRSCTISRKCPPADANDELPGLSAFYKDEDGRRLPHLFELCAGAGRADRHLDDPRPRARRAATRKRSWTGCAATTSTTRRRR